MAQRRTADDLRWRLSIVAKAKSEHQQQLLAKVLGITKPAV